MPKISTFYKINLFEIFYSQFEFISSAFNLDKWVTIRLILIFIKKSKFISIEIIFVISIVINQVFIYMQIVQLYNKMIINVSIAYLQYFIKKLIFIRDNF